MFAAETKFKRYGAPFLEITQSYAQKRQRLSGGYAFKSNSNNNFATSKETMSRFFAPQTYGNFMPASTASSSSSSVQPAPMRKF
jgi:hypothetical protein